MATDKEIACVLAKQRWRAALDEYGKSAAKAVEYHGKVEGDAVYVARQKQVLDEENVKLTYLNEKVDARKGAIGNASDPAEILRLEGEIAELDSERDGHRTRRSELESEISAIASRDYENRRELADGKDGIAKYYAELQAANADMQTHCDSSESLPAIPSL